MYRINSVGVLSVARITGAIYGGLALLFVPVVLVMMLVGGTAAPGGEKLPLLFGFLALLLPVIYAVVGFVGGAIMAAIYNFVAGKLGGFELQLDVLPPLPAAVAVSNREVPRDFPPSS